MKSKLNRAIELLGAKCLEDKRPTGEFGRHLDHLYKLEAGWPQRCLLCREIRKAVEKETA